MTHDLRGCNEVLQILSRSSVVLKLPKLYKVASDLFYIRCKLMEFTSWAFLFLSIVIKNLVFTKTFKLVHLKKLDALFLALKDALFLALKDALFLALKSRCLTSNDCCGSFSLGNLNLHLIWNRLLPLFLFSI